MPCWSTNWAVHATSVGEVLTRMNIIIADHSSEVRSKLKSFLEEIPGTTIVGEASQLEETFSMVSNLKPEVVILNFPMPGEDGLSNIQQIKKLPEPPILMIVSNFSSPEYQSACSQAGADYFFDKSFEFEKIQETIKSLIQGHSPQSESV